jgi:hypothetical protein
MCNDRTELHNHFNQERRLYNRETFKLNRTATLAQWRQLTAYVLPDLGFEYQRVLI